MTVDHERLLELGEVHFAPRTRPAAEIAARARQLRRRRAATAGVTTVLGTALLAGSVLAWGLPRSGDSAPSAGRAQLQGPPWPLPSAPYEALYQDVRLSFPGGTATCGKRYDVDLRDPAASSGDPVAAGAPAGDLMIRPGCATPGAAADFGVPSAWMTSGFGTPKIGPRATVDDCARTMGTWLRADQRHILSRAVETERLTVCALAAPDPAKGRPLAVVRVELELTAGHGIEATFSAWSGGPPTLVQPVPVMSPQPEPPQVKAVAPPFRMAYEDVALHLPGKPEACGDEEFYLDLQVPEVNHRLGPSDMYLRPPCEPDHPRELQGLGVAVPGSDPTADRCAAALQRGPSSHEFTPVVGSSFCSLSQATPWAPEPKLVALTVTKVDPATGAFDLSATAWTGTGVLK